MPKLSPRTVLAIIMAMALLTMVFAVVVTAMTLAGGSSILGSRAASSLSSPLVDDGKSVSCREGFRQTCNVAKAGDTS